ncbi:MAG: hypothetical protein E4H13_10495 [Calditrichales bacterium]|nr:MAG: hypothetical protein E4H13_10495 [Calditrichales bacterium]
MKLADALQQELPEQAKATRNDLKLVDGSQIGVVGGGPAGSFFSYFLLDMAERIGLSLTVDIYEPRDFMKPSPAGCNMCGGIISETLVQMLATEGIKLPENIIQRGIVNYALHTDMGDVNIETPLKEKRIGAVHRGCGPKTIKDIKWGSFDGYLQVLALEKGANLFQKKVDDVNWDNGKPQVFTKDLHVRTYDLLVVATGVNTNSLKLFPKLNPAYKPPRTTKTFIREYYLGQEEISRYFGNSMHIFLLDVPRLDFAAFIPKGDFVTFCMLGKNIDGNLMASFMANPVVKRVVPQIIYEDHNSCHCNPKINISPAHHPYADRLVFIGDSGVSRLYKDGIGAAYRTAKAAARAVIFEGISESDLKKHFWPACKSMSNDNLIGKLVFQITHISQKIAVARAAILHMVRNEQQDEKSRKIMSTVLWDMFTGSATYREIFLLTLHPVFLFKFVWGLIVSSVDLLMIRLSGD